MGLTLEEHDRNLCDFQAAALECSMSFNLENCKFRQTQISVLGYLVSEKVLKQDPDRFTALFSLDIPRTPKQLLR